MSEPQSVNAEDGRVQSKVADEVLWFVEDAAEEIVSRVDLGGPERRGSGRLELLVEALAVLPPTIAIRHHG